MTLSRAGRVAYYGIPILTCFLVYRYAFQAWFSMDDFAWLSLPMQVHTPGDLLEVLFRPQAQGTVRVFSERAFFLTLSSLFGLETLPFRVVVFATQFANLLLLSWIAQRLTGSLVAGFIAPMLYVFNPALSTPMGWASSYNQVLCAFVVLFCFWCFLRYVDTGRRRFWILQWVVLILGFGVLELAVVYPAVALLYAVCCARPYIRKALWLFVPAIAFATVHLALIPKNSTDIYRMYFDSALPGTFWHYFWSALGPTELNRARIAGYVVTALNGIALAVFAAIQLRRRNRLPVFLCGWFVLFLAPVVPLKNHLIPYYVAVPVLGLCILGAWAFVSAWKRPGIGAAAIATVLAAGYAIGGYRQIRWDTKWRHDHSHRIKGFLEDVDQAWKRKPRPYLLFSGVDRDLYSIGFMDEPFLLYGLPRPYLAPGSEDQLLDPEPPRGLAKFKIPLADAVNAMNEDKALVLAVSDSGVRDVTAAYRLIAGTQPLPRELFRVDVALPSAAPKLGPTWYPVENGFRWMPGAATVRLAGPSTKDDKLHLTGYCPAVVLSKGTMRLTVKADGEQVGTAEFTQSDAQFELAFPLPARLLGRETMEIELSVDHTVRTATDSRELGLVFGVFEIRPWMVLDEWGTAHDFLLNRMFPDARIRPARIGESWDDVLPAIAESCSRFFFHLNATFTATWPAGREELGALLATRGVRCFNAGAVDVSKRRLHRECERLGLGTTLASSEGDPAELLIVKTDLNYGGAAERRLSSSQRRRLGMPEPSRGVAAVQRLARSQQEYPLMLRRGVPPEWWSDEQLVIERFVENRAQRFARVHFLGDRTTLTHATCRKPIKKLPGSESIEHSFFIGEETDASGIVCAANRLRRALRLDFGAMDIVLDDNGGHYFIDVNHTPYSGVGGSTWSTITCAPGYEGRVDAAPATIVCIVAGSIRPSVTKSAVHNGRMAGPVRPA